MATKLSTKMEFCYGIPELEHEFSFENNNMPIAVYASNGVMKTSFARAFKKYSNGEKPEDLVYPERVSSFTLSDENGDEIDKQAIFVTEPINEKYVSDRISTLLASDQLKAEYDEVFRSIGSKKALLLKALKKKAGLTKNIENFFANSFGLKEAEFLVALGRLEREVKSDANVQFADIEYKTIFNSKVHDFLKNEEIKNLIGEYTQVYDKLLEDSRFFKKGVFNHTNAVTVAKSLADNGWFQGGHSVSLKSNGNTEEIVNEEELRQKVENEKVRILYDPTLGEMFEKVDDAIKTRELRALRDYLLRHPYIVPELQDLQALERKVWLAYITTMKPEYFDLIEEYDNSQAKLKEIVAKAEAETTRWEHVISVFNQRFSVPFKVRIENKSDAVLGIEGPQFAFRFKDENGHADKKLSREELGNVLSNGERRALYILNIIFEVEARLRGKIETFFIIDDIADSFDYKNKYAIVEYLWDMKQTDYFHLIILSHNFDFHRTIKSRLGIYQDNNLIARKSPTSVSLNRDTLNDNPFSNWTRDLENSKSAIAAIPFVRNLADYTGKKEAYTKLTSLLHIKQNSNEIRLSDLKEVYQELLCQEMTESCIEGDDKVIELIFDECEAILDQGLDDVDLREKIVLSIGIRLKTELFLIQKINDKNYVSKLSKNQTTKLIKKFTNEHNPGSAEVDTLQRVILMTPENIHMNSFMFEPILDMSPHHLHKLYQDVCELSELESNN